MPIETIFDRVRGLWFHVVRGTFNADDVIEAQAQVYAAPGDRPKNRVLWNLLDADARDLSQDEIRWMVYLSRRFWDTMRDGKSAIVTPGDREYGLARMYQSIADEMPRRLRVFRACEEALAWLQEEEAEAGPRRAKTKSIERECKPPPDVRETETENDLLEKKQRE